MSTAIHFGLQGRVAIVTGASQGIGEACARRLAADGAAVALWDVADAKGEELAAALRAQGVQARYVHCDVSRKAEVEAALAQTLQAFGHVDALVNNAGIFRAADFLDIAEAQFTRGAFLAGDDFTLADIQFGHVLFRYFDIAIARPNRPALRHYHEALATRPAYREHVMVSYDELRVLD